MLHHHKPCVNNTTNKFLQPCTKYVPIMHQLHINYDSSWCTKIINYTPHVCANSSTTCLNHVPNMYLNHIPNTYTNITIKIYLTIHHSINKPNTINHVPQPHCYTTSICNIPQPKSLINFIIQIWFDHIYLKHYITIMYLKPCAITSLLYNLYLYQ